MCTVHAMGLSNSTVISASLQGGARFSRSTADCQPVSQDGLAVGPSDRRVMWAGAGEGNVCPVLRSMKYVPSAHSASAGPATSAKLKTTRAILQQLTRFVRESMPNLLGKSGRHE